MYQYLLTTKILENEEKRQVILSNSTTGLWIKLPKEWKEILDQLMKYKKTYKEYLQLFECEEDRKQFDHMVHLLEEKEFISDGIVNNTVNFKKIYFALTERCNLRCTHCCYDAMPANIKSDLSTEDIIKILDKIIEAYPDTIILSGGEPLIRNDFMELLIYLREHFNRKIILSTNALLITQNNIDALTSMIDEFAISLDGYDEESCSRIRGKGVFSKVVDTVKVLKAKGAKKISLSMVETEQIKANINLFKQLNERLGTEPAIRVLTPVGRGTNLINGEKYIKSVYTERKLSDEEALKYSSTCLSCKCGGASKDLLINYDGSIYPCGLLIDEAYQLGNIFQFDSLKEFYNKMKEESGYKNFENLMPQKFSPCKDCNVNIFCWECLKDLDLAKNHPELIPLRCSIRKENLTKIIWGN